MSPEPRSPRPLDPGKFRERQFTATGARRASVALERLETLWFNTGTLCNIECLNCYIDSSPDNDRLAYLTVGEVERYLEELARLDLNTRQIGFTGGEPFMNPGFLEMLQLCLKRSFGVLVLTNAMRPMMRPAVLSRLLRLLAEHGDRLHVRVSLDHYTDALHEEERGEHSWSAALEGLRWLAASGFSLSVAGRTRWQESAAELRQGYARLFRAEGLALDAFDPAALVLFPEMDATVDVPEITVDCWDILGVEPAAMMCASSRMVVKRRKAESPTILTCTLLPYDPQFELGQSLSGALGPVWLNHPHCARFCVLGGASCSVRQESLSSFDPKSSSDLVPK